VGAPVIRAAARVNHADDEQVRADLAGMPALVDHVDSLLRAGTIGGAQPNVADFQIATAIPFRRGPGLR
jgi:glutathione S-transferase